MPTTNLVSVIIPFYNRTALVCRAIDSVLKQSYKKYEIILIDDGSSDDISNVLNKINKINYIKIFRQTNNGPSSARNVGIKHAKGEYIAFLDSDDTWDSKKLEVQINYMILSGYKFTHTSYHRVSDSIDKVIVNSGKHDYTYPLIAFHCKIATPTVIVHASLLTSMRFKEDLFVGEDTVLWIELSKMTTLHGLLDCLVEVHIDENTTAHNIESKRSAFLSINKALNNDFFLQKIHWLYIWVRHTLKII